MDITIVIGQLCIMVFYIIIGNFLFRKNKLSDESSRHISGLVVNFCNPAALICSAITAGERVSNQTLILAFGLTCVLYAVLILAGWVFPYLLSIPKKEHYMYQFLSTYGNVGFLGIPLVSAVLGSDALIYVSINCLVFNLIFYTMALSTIRKEAGIKSENVVKDTLHKLINVGTISAIVTIFIYVFQIHVPAVIVDGAAYMGRCTTFLSMLVLGVSVAQMPLRSIFNDVKTWLFLLLRMIVVPVCITLILKNLISDPILLGSTVLLVSVPAANMPLMSSREYGLPTQTLARAIILSTLISVATIPIVVLFI